MIEFIYIYDIYNKKGSMLNERTINERIKASNER